jgi:hypothetical protein
MQCVDLRIGGTAAVCGVRVKLRIDREIITIDAVCGLAY